MKRAAWIDSCRFFAIFVIMVTHFLDMVNPEALMLWETAPTSWLLYGLTGKFSVAFFFVFLGYFASKPVKSGITSLFTYSVRRYFQFAFYILIVSFVYICGSYGVTWLFHSADDALMRVLSDGFRYNIIYMLRDAFLFEDNYNATLWCMQQLFLASIVCRLIAHLPEKLPAALRLAIDAAIIAALMIINAKFCVWICAAVLGHILRILISLENNSNNPALLITAAVTAIVLIKLKMPESVLQYSIQSLAAFLLIYVQFNFRPVQHLLSKAPLPWLGSISMGLFVVHTPIYSLLHSSLYSLCLKFMPSFAAGLILFVVSLGLCIFCSWLLKCWYEQAVNLIGRAIVKKQKISIS